MPSHDTLVLDRSGAVRLWTVMTATVEQLGRDRLVVGALVQRAGDLLRRDRTAPTLDLRRAHVALEDLAHDLRRRLDRIDGLWADVDAIDAISRRIEEWPGTDNDPRLDALVRERRRRVVDFVGGDEVMAVAVLRSLDAGLSLPEAVGAARRRLLGARVDEAMDALGLDRGAAVAHVAELDRQMALVVDHGHPPAHAAVAVATAVTLDLDIEESLGLAAEHGVAPVVALGWMAAAAGIGVTVAELRALDGLITHFPAFDDAGGARPDGRVSERDLHAVVADPTEFTDGQVVAARALLDHPELLARLDSAAENGVVLEAERFGLTRRADGIVSRHDLQSFMVKAQITSVLGPYADRIDVAADPGGDADGFHSRADIERFLADTPDLPDEVQAVARSMLERGWFDRTWFEEHRDELAMGAAVLAGGAVIVVSAGTATPVAMAVGGGVAGAAASGATTLAVNATGDAEDTWDDVGANTIDGAMVGFSVAGMPSSFVSVGSTSGAARFVAAAGATSDVAGVVSSGGLDLLLPEEVEDEVHAVTGAVSELAGLVASAGSDPG